jgi:hypothetical protein
VVEGTGLENRHARKGIEGSNPSPSVVRVASRPLPWTPFGYLGTMPHLLMQAAGMAPDDCSLSGLCALLRPEPAIPPGIMYVAVGLVAIGLWGYRRSRKLRDT